MKIICKNCNNTIDGAKVTVHLLDYIGEQLLPYIKTFVESYFKQKIVNFWEPENKSFFDESMALIANKIKLKCPECKKISWEIIQQIEHKPKAKKTSK